ncbi:(deoxy)nucleoside triphosphate pyrophosphohydrolase [Desulfurispira natronophila]|uniref:8-oxo-dGTP diphosphatase n=1 Tax=Desulfurispira natronophila TaxID=682562 RepID=A0A7W7Y5G1_9BACT|nr:(deoxy)nucleoside triphosphate pyrophosphohydrolase [Desulfurispira natronophila]MBB5022342.1 8-oxo-dGTP diphosphatase [Desulfurispira natronophila]
MQPIDVTCAIIERDDQILIAQRSESMSLPLKWEFPGGKIRAGESPSDCLVREIDEELGVKVTVVAALPLVTHHYPEIAVTLHPFVCTQISGDLVLAEHVDCCWVNLESLSSYDLAAADIPVVQSYARYRRNERAE